MVAASRQPPRRLQQPKQMVEDKIEMEPKVEAIQKNIASSTRGLFLREQNSLKHFTIPKRTPDPGLLTECSINQRDYSEIKQRLSQSCLDTQCKLECLWQFEKIEILHNKFLEEEFVAKRSKLREQGRQDKELSSFLVVSKDEVSTICQKGLHIGHSKKERNIMKELGNPQLGVYLFRYVDTALSYASAQSIPVENIIIFRVLLGKVKKIQPPKGKKKVALDPTPNFDCHISRNHPSLQDSLEDQAIGSLVYFYEYNELSKPVDKPRQCLPYAVIKVKRANQNVVADTPVTSSKCKPKRFPKHVGRGRGLPLENCTRVTRIGKSKLIYECFRKPDECCAVNSDNNTSVEMSSFSGSIQNWNSSVAESQCKKNKRKSTRWDSAQMEANEVNIQHTLGEDVRSDHMGSSNKSPLKTFMGISPVCNSGSSTVTTSRLMKDPRLTKREQNLGKQSEEAIFHGSSQNEKEMKISANVSIPYPVPKGSFLLDSKHEFSQRQYVEKTSRKESTSEEHVLPPLLNRDEDYKENNEQLLGNINKEILPSYNAYMEHFLKTYVSYSSLKSKDFKNNSSTIIVEDLKGEKGMNYSEVKLANARKSLDSKPVSITVHCRKEKPIIEPPFYDHTDINICKQNPESVTSGKDKMDHRGEMGSHLQEDDGYTSEIDCSTDFDRKCVINNCTSSEREGDDSKTYRVQDHTLPSGFCKNVHTSENMRAAWTENNYGFEWSSDQMGANNFEQNKPQETIQSEKSCVERANNSIYKKEQYTRNKGKESPTKERISDIHNMYYSPDTSRSDSVMRDFSERSMCLSKLESLDKNIFRDSRECSSLGIFVDGQRDHETYIVGADGFDQKHTAQLEEGSLGEEKCRRYTPEIQIFCATENVAHKTSGNQQNYVETDLKIIDDINCTKTSEYSDTLVSESSACVRNLNFQRCSLTETQLMSIESGKEKFEDLQEQALLTKSVGLTTHQEKNHIDFILNASDPVPLGNIEHTEIKKPQSMHTSPSNANFEMLNNTFSCRDSISEILEQGLDVKCEDTNIRDLEVTKEFENALEQCKKCLLVPQKLCSHGNTSSEEGEYQYLQKRIDWDNLLGKPSLKIQVSGNSFMKVNENWEKSGVEDKETESLNTFMCPDLRITVNNKFQSKLKAKIGKRPAKYSGHKMGIKCMHKKKMEKRTQSQKKPKLCHKKKKINIHRSSEMCSALSKGQFKKIVQSEKHIKNILNTLNTEALLCKNKCLSQKIDGAMFHLKKARRTVRALKSEVKVGRKNPRDSSKLYKILHCRTLHLDSSAASSCISDMTSSSENVRNIKIKELETISEKPTNLDIMELKNNFSSEANSCTSKNIAKHLNSTTEKKELVCQADQRKGEHTFKCDVTMSTIKFATPVQTALESCAKVVKPDDISMLSPIFTMQENVFSNKKEILGRKPAKQDSINMRIGVGRCSASSTFLPIAEDKHDMRVCQIHLNSQMHGAESLSLKTRSNSLSNTNLERNCSGKLTEYFNKQQEEDPHNKNNNLKSEHYFPNKLGQAAEQELHTAENRKYKPLTASMRQPENNTEGVSSSEFQPKPLIDNNLFLSSHHYALQEHKVGEIEETGILKTKTEFSNIKPNVKNNIPVKIGFEQKDTIQTSHIPSEESICKQTSSNTDQVIGLHSDSLFRTVSEQDVEAIPATAILSPACYDVMPNKTTKNFTTSGTRLNENCFSGEHSNNCKDFSSDIKRTKVEMEPKSLDFKIKISEILQKADETSSLNILHGKIMFCRSSLPFFVTAFEKKQGGSLEQVLVSREILGNGERNMQTNCKLKPCAIEALVELQIIMETIEFIENKKRFIEGEPTFRSLLWYDDSLCSELFGGQSGYQQQSNFYPAFQRRLKYSAVKELQSYHKQLVEVFESTRWENNSYYSFLKSRREIEECEAAMKSNSPFSDFFLSVPYVCGANYGDTLEDLENARKNTVELINICKSLAGINFSAEKEEHFWVIIEIIATKIEFITTCEEVNIKTSLFGLEHIFFDAAKSLAWREREGCINGVLKDGVQQQMLEINEAALSKLYEIYDNMVEECGSGNLNSALQDDVARKSAEEFYNFEKPDRQQKASNFVTNSPVLHQDICCIGEILDEAQSANTERLEQLMCRCTEHMEMLKAYFQILQEEDDNVFITKENVLGFMKSGGIRSVILKPEAVEVYTEIAMIHETVFFLKNSIARKVDKPRFRSLLWFDLSLLPELFRCQEKMASLSYRKDNLLKMIESSVSELQDELSVIYDYAENLNCSYALHLLSRELAELAETRNLLQKSKSPISMCVDLVPYTICLNYGSTVSELECNYSQFSKLLEKLMLAERKDLGKMAHIMKIMKTIEHMKFVCSEQGKSPLPLVIYQMLKNWRKACQLRRQDVKTHLDTSVEQRWGSDTHLKRPVDVSLEDSHCSEEKSDCSHRKKKKVAASLMTTTKIHEKEANRDLRKSEKYNFPKGKELQLSILTDNTWNKNIKVLTERSPISPFKCIPSSPNASNSSFINSDTLANQKNLANIKDFNKSSKSCQSVKENDQEYFASDDRGKCVSLSSMTFQSPQRSLEDTSSSVAKLDGDSSLLHTLNEHHDLTSDVLGNDSHLMPECSTAKRLSPEPDRDVEKSEIPNSDSSVVTELNETMELECSYSEPSFNGNTERTAECSASSQNEYLEETSQMQSSSVHICRTAYPNYSWYSYQTDSNSQSVTQTYQEFKSYQTHQLTPGISTAASMVNNAQSSMFYSQTFSHFGVRGSQSFNFAQAYPAHGYFNSTVAFPFSYHQQPSWYTAQPLAQDTFLYPYNIGL